MRIVRIVGIGDDGPASLNAKTLQQVLEADVLIGGGRLLDFFPDIAARKVSIKANIADVVATIEAARDENVVVLASGDPNFYGIARSLVRALGKDRVEIAPNVSSVQLAFARVKESWEDADIFSLHGRAAQGQATVDELIAAARSKRKIAVLTDANNTPACIARQITAAGVTGYKAFVCENLGSPRERVTESGLEELVDQEFSPLNVLVLVAEAAELTEAKTAAAKPVATNEESRRSDDPFGPSGDTALAPPRSRQWTFGIPDEEFSQRKPLRGLITKAEVRVVSLSKLALGEDSVIWDVGAGSGSVSIEAALLARRGRVFAIERTAEGVALINQNVARFGVGNVTVIEGSAPEALDGLPAPDAIFVGGSGGRMREIVAIAAARLRPNGRIVVNLATIESLSLATTALREHGFHSDVTQLSVARGKAVGSLTHLAALDPVFIVSGHSFREGGD